MPMVTGTKKKWKIVVTPNCRRASSSEVMRRIFEGTARIAIGGGHASASVVVRDAPGAAPAPSAGRRGRTGEEVQVARDRHVGRLGERDRHRGRRRGRRGHGMGE